MIPAATAAHCFVDDLDAPECDPGDNHHLVRVLRVQVGESLTVSDGEGRWRECAIVSVSPVRLEATGPVVEDPLPDPPITVAFTPTKGDRPAWTVQKLTELGVDRIGLLRSDRSVVRWESGRAEPHVERLRVVARAAAMQSRRSRLPTIVGPVMLRDWTEPAALCDRSGTDDLDLTVPALMVGPEGGWSDAELGRNGPMVSLGANILRTETAALVAGTLLVALRGGTVRARSRGDWR